SWKESGSAAREPRLRPPAPCRERDDRWHGRAESRTRRAELGAVLADLHDLDVEAWVGLGSQREPVGVAPLLPHGPPEEPVRLREVRLDNEGHRHVWERTPGRGGRNSGHQARSGDARPRLST